MLSCSKNNSTTDKKSNYLINETSPYLLQHSYNPVNWKSWNSKTLELAKFQDNEYINPNKYHPNQKGHSLIAEKLFKFIR